MKILHISYSDTKGGAAIAMMRLHKSLINQNIDTACLEVYEPVCGCNIQTYSNECYARKAGVTAFVVGECN